MSTLTLSTVPSVHSMFRGDATKTVAKLDKNKLTGKLQNSHIKPRLEWLTSSQLVPMETQRETKDKWVYERQVDLNGLDMIALGALSVALDPNDNIYYVWDGCGRWAIADTNGALSDLPCLVYDMTKEQAAFYFAYNQERGRRKLSREVTFVNAFVGGDKESLVWEQRLIFLGCYIKGQTNYSVPHPQTPGNPEIKFRTLEGGFQIARGDMSIQRQARDMIHNAWASTNYGCETINQDLYFALVKTLTDFDDARKNGINKGLQQWLNWAAQGKTQSGFSQEWKDDTAKGLTGNMSAAGILAKSFLKVFLSPGNQFKPSNARNVLKLKDIDSTDTEE